MYAAAEWLKSRYVAFPGACIVAIILAAAGLRPRAVLLGFLVVLLLYAVPKSIRDYRASRGK